MSSAGPSRRVVLVDGVPMSGLTVQVADPRGVVVAVHGGATTSAYFDCPGRPALSLLRAAAAQGFSAIALDRPGYGASGLYADGFAGPAQRVAAASGAIDAMLRGAARGAGLFLVGHSAGCELALRMAITHPEVRGVEIAGTGLRYSDAARDVIEEASVTSRPAGLRDLLWQPTDLYPAEVLTGALSAPGAAYEGEVTANWPRRDFPATAAQVRVPVQFSVAEHESVWESDPESVAAIAALFTLSPRVRVNAMSGSGHNLSVGHSAGEYHRRVLSFVEDCLAAPSGRDTDHVEAS